MALCDPLIACYKQYKGASRNIDERKNKIIIYRGAFSKESLTTLSDEELKEKLKHALRELWSRVYKSRDENRIISENNIRDIREAFLNLLYGDDFDRAYEYIINNIKYVGPAVLTEILHFVYPEKHVIWNSRVVDALKKTGRLRELLDKLGHNKYQQCDRARNLNCGSLAKSSENYRVIRDYLLQLTREISMVTGDNIDLDVLDDLFDYIYKGCNLENGPIMGLLERFPNIIFYGPPGTGKTFKALHFPDDSPCPFKRVEFITFHQSYSYEEFVEGYRPVSVGGSISYHVVDGIFKRLAYRAFYDLLRIISTDAMGCSGSEDYECVRKAVRKVLEKISIDKDYYSEVRKSYRKSRGRVPNYLLVIDEINRGDVSRVFGELITLLEPDKRLLAENQVIVELPYSGEPFGVPPNLYIIGTMNSADRSIALVDYALRRRFAFIYVKPDPRAIIEDNGDGSGVVEGVSLPMLLEKLNERLQEKLDEDHLIGHSYFMGIKSLKDLYITWCTQIIPLLKEYFYDRSRDEVIDILGTHSLYDVCEETSLLTKTIDQGILEKFRKLLEEFIGSQG